MFSSIFIKPLHGVASKRLSCICCLQVGQMLVLICPSLDSDPNFCNLAASSLFLISSQTSWISEVKRWIASSITDSLYINCRTISSKESIADSVSDSSLLSDSKLSVTRGFNWRNELYWVSSCLFLSPMVIPSLAKTPIRSRSVSESTQGKCGIWTTSQDSAYTFFWISWTRCFHSFSIAVFSVLRSSFSFSFFKVSSPRMYSTTLFLDSLIPNIGIPDKRSDQPCFCSINIAENIICKYNFRSLPSDVCTKGRFKCRNSSRKEWNPRLLVAECCIFT